MPVGETIKMVGIRKNPNEPLGLTVKEDDFNQLVVARILSGGMIDRQGLLNPGDVILEVNGVGVNTPEDLQTEISRAKESVTLKIGPNIEDEMKSARLTATGSAQVKSKSQDAGKKLAVSKRFQAFYGLNFALYWFLLSPTWNAFESIWWIDLEMFGIIFVLEIFEFQSGFKHILHSTTLSSFAFLTWLKHLSDRFWRIFFCSRFKLSLNHLYL